jgi:hypothetical protein
LAVCVGAPRHPLDGLTEVWCGPCRYFAPIFEASSEEHPGMVFAKVDTEAEPELAVAFGIMSIPTLMVFRDQIVRLLVSIGSPTSKPKKASPTNNGLTCGAPALGPPPVRPRARRRRAPRRSAQARRGGVPSPTAASGSLGRPARQGRPPGAGTPSPPRRARRGPSQRAGKALLRRSCTPGPRRRAAPTPPARAARCEPTRAVRGSRSPDRRPDAQQSAASARHLLRVRSVVDLISKTSVEDLSGWDGRLLPATSWVNHPKMAGATCGGSTSADLG